MIRLPIIWRIFRREALDAFRNWNVLFVTLLLPFATAPLAGLALAEIASQQAAAKAAESDVGSLGKDKPSKGRTYKVAVIGAAGPAFAEKIAARHRFTVIPWGEVPGKESLWQIETERPPPQAAALREEMLRRIAAAELDAVLVATSQPVPDQDLTNIRLFLFSDQTVSSSGKAAAALGRVGEEWQREFRAERLESIGLSESALRPLQFRSDQLASKARQLTHQLAPLLTVFFFLVLAAGCYYSASYAIAGEKEHGTLATLLAAPVRPTELLMGKWLNVTLIGIVGALANTLSILCAALLMVRSASRQLPGTSLLDHASFSWDLFWPSGGLMLGNLILLGMALGSLTLVLCMFARSQNDSTYLITPFILFVGLPAAISMLPDVEWQARTAVIPLLNNALIIRGLIRQETLGAGLLLLSLGINAIFCLAVLAFGARMFESERVRFNELQGSWKEILSRRAAVPLTAMISALVVLLLLVGNFYLNMLATGAGFVPQVLVVQAWTALVPLGIVWFLRLPWREALSWRAPRTAVWPGAILLGATAWTAALPFLKLFPVPEEWTKQFAEPFLQLLAKPGGLATVLLLAAVLPAICEEIAFRGVVLSGLLRRFSPGVAILLTSLCFGIAHYSVFRFLPTAILGVFLSWTAWRTKSLFPGMVIHAINNGLAILVMTLSAGKSSEESMPSWPIIAAGATGFLLAVLLLRHATAAPKARGGRSD